MQIDGETMETVTDFIFLGSKITADGDCSHEIKRCFLFERKIITNLGSILKTRDIIFLTKVHIVKVMVFLVVMYECVCSKRRLSTKELTLQIVVLEKTLESPLDARRSSVNPKGNQPWIFTGRTDAEAEAPILWSPDVKRSLTGKYPEVGKDWSQEEKGKTEDMNLSKLQVKDRKLAVLQSMGSQRVRHD